MTTFVGPEFYTTNDRVRLTPRQLEVLAWLAEGKEDDAIATILGRSARTIREHVDNLRDTFNASNRHQLIARAFAWGALHARLTIVTLMMIAATGLHDAGALRPRPPKNHNRSVATLRRDDAQNTAEHGPQRDGGVRGAHCETTQYIKPAPHSG